MIQKHTAGMYIIVFAIGVLLSLDVRGVGAELSRVARSRDYMPESPAHDLPSFSDIFGIVEEIEDPDMPPLINEGAQGLDPEAEIVFLPQDNGDEREGVDYFFPDDQFSEDEFFGDEQD